MSQHDMVIDNGPGLGVRTDMNAALQALASCSLGLIEPTTMYPGQLWLDTSVAPSGVLRMRNQANAAWSTAVAMIAPPVVPGITNGTIDSGTDWDLIPATAGWYSQLLGVANGHHPVAGQYFFCQTLVFASANLTQIAWPYGLTASISAGVYYRGRFSGTWTGWRKIVSSDTSDVVNLGAISFTGATNGIQLIGSTGAIYHSVNSSAATPHARFYNPTAPNLNGSITTNAAVTAYNTSSDENFKNVTGDYPASDAAAIIRADPVQAFTWKETGDSAVGWLAQRSYAVDPNLATPPAYTEEDLAMRADAAVEPKPGEEGYVPWGIDYGRRTPYLWAALTGALDQIDQLTARIAALEAAAAGP